MRKTDPLAGEGRIGQGWRAGGRDALCEQVPVLTVGGDDAQRAVVEETLLVRDDVGVAQRGEQLRPRTPIRTLDPYQQPQQAYDRF